MTRVFSWHVDTHLDFGFLVFLSLSSAQPDILEDEENESVDAKSMRSDSESTHCGRDDGDYEKAQAKGRPKRLRWLWCLFSSLLHKYPGGKVSSVKNVNFDPDFDCKA
ncbi:hypothetical protein BDZ94DRAFT_1260692 [Collybia nuda]|uniref:Uncharacterized protein n=1 Tax=Collybia nuda TaxID=64659 RepID=A0A9P6CEA3_9AGAR|nr:hypothetical protein BDZ94DRAFT_1260692 [Collybia nuda]